MIYQRALEPFPGHLLPCTGPRALRPFPSSRESGVCEPRDLLVGFVAENDSGSLGQALRLVQSIR
ncbi:MAG TPA: hypothetical protein VJ885_03295 [Thermoanaerobaculia bacterium]|nr:hypothetical protein [Thermoanaerobaculia bacterium]